MCIDAGEGNQLTSVDRLLEIFNGLFLATVTRALLVMQPSELL